MRRTVESMIMSLFALCFYYLVRGFAWAPLFGAVCSIAMLAGFEWMSAPAKKADELDALRQDILSIRDDISVLKLAQGIAPRARN